MISNIISFLYINRRILFHLLFSVFLFPTCGSCFQSIRLRSSLQILTFLSPHLALPLETSLQSCRSKIRSSTPRSLKIALPFSPLPLQNSFSLSILHNRTHCSLPRFPLLNAVSCLRIPTTIFDYLELQVRFKVFSFPFFASLDIFLLLRLKNA